MRIGFLFNHDQIHQVAHSLPIALALARDNPAAEIVLATTSQKLDDEVDLLLGAHGCRNIRRLRLGLRSLSHRAGVRLLGAVAPAARLLVYGDNLAFFRSLDAMIVTERTSLVLKSRYRIDRPLMILADHGAGDRAIGFGKSAALFDHVLAAGPKIRDRMIGDAGVSGDRITITGYPKFDAAPATPVRLRMLDNGRPTILYNPHLSPHLSSWYSWGRQILDWFLAQDRYNLIFAPHVMLFQRRVVFTIDRLRMDFPGTVGLRHARAPHIHIDLGSRACTNMAYTNCADIYLGDASSQVYEFLKTPRPCVFLNPNGFDFAGDSNFAHWRAGPVVANLEDLGKALESSALRHADTYLGEQRKLMDYTFDVAPTPASERAAEVIAQLVRSDRSVKTATG